MVPKVSTITRVDCIKAYFLTSRMLAFRRTILNSLRFHIIQNRLWPRCMSGYYYDRSGCRDMTTTAVNAGMQLTAVNVGIWLWPRCILGYDWPRCMSGYDSDRCACRDMTMTAVHAGISLWPQYMPGYITRLYPFPGIGSWYGLEDR